MGDSRLEHTYVKVNGASQIVTTRYKLERIMVRDVTQKEYDQGEKPKYEFHIASSTDGYCALNAFIYFC